MTAPQRNSESAAKLHALLANVEAVIYGKTDIITKVICSWICGGHVLLEDVPGTGKTMLARALAQSVDLSFKRTQFTPDLLPSDITGVNVYNRKTEEFEFRPGPVFSTLFLADEINRATPRTQSALLEAMSEKQVTVDGRTYPLDPLFFVIATENPVEQAGTFLLPEAQLDRFHIRIGLGYPDDGMELKIVRSQERGHPIAAINPVVNQSDLANLRAAAQTVAIHDPVVNYALAIVKKTRNHPELVLGASPRASLALIQLAKALVLFSDGDFVHPDHIQEFVAPVLAHRIVLSPEARFSGRTANAILDEIVKSVPVPLGL